MLEAYIQRKFNVCHKLGTWRYLDEAAHENAKAFHDKCENSSVSSYGAG